MATPVQAPPKPTREPDVHLKGKRGAHKRPRTLKGDIRAVRGKVSAGVTKWSEGRKAGAQKRNEVRKQAKEILEPAKQKVSEEKALASEVLKPVQAALGVVREGLDTQGGTTRPAVTSFMISSAASWVVGPQILLASYERIRFHTSTTSWGVLHGPGRWFRDTVGMAYETDQMPSLVWAIVIGILPMLILNLRNVAASHVGASPYQSSFARKNVRRLSMASPLVIVLYFTGISYPGWTESWFGVTWTLAWWQFWVMCLFCTAWYCTMWVFDRIEKHLELGFFHALLMVPLASIVTGVLLYAPGAAW